MKRREFLIGLGVAASAGRTWGDTPDKAKLDRIAIMSGCFSAILKSPAHPDDPKRTLDIMDLPDMYAQRYGVHHVEMQHTHFLSTEKPWMKEFHDRMKKAKAQMNQINLEFGPLNISTPDPVIRLETIDLSKQWIDYAVELDCPRVMVNQGTLAPDVRENAIKTLRTIVEYGKTQKVFVTMENRGGGGGRGRAGAPTPAAAPAAPATPPRVPGATWEVVVEVIKAAGAWANPDIGNFPDEEARHAGLRVMYPMTSGSSHCHYAPERWNFADALKISKEMNYKGLYSIEHGGPDPYPAVQMVIDNILKNI